VNRELALVERQRHDAVREGALFRDEIVALREKLLEAHERYSSRSVTERNRLSADLTQLCRSVWWYAADRERCNIVTQIKAERNRQRGGEQGADARERDHFGA
jgi:hypothetical protein